MKETYLRIFSNAKQEVGLPPPTPEQVTVLNNQATQLAAELSLLGTCCGDGNQNAPTYQDQPGNIPGYACCGNEFEGLYIANSWLYPYDIDNLQFVVNIDGSGFNPCEFGGKGGEELG